MKTFVIAGGTSGIGLEAARQLLAEGHRVILLGRSAEKGRAALESFGAARDRAQFHSVDLSTHDGVRAAARRVAEATDQIDGLLHSAADFVTENVRTKDGLPLFVALGYMSRYHLTQLLLPQLLKAEHPRVMMFIAGFRETPKFDPQPFPNFPKKFSFFRGVVPINAAGMHYADYLMKTNPKIFAGTACPGAVRTTLFDKAPWYLRAMAALSHALAATPLETSARNAVRALLTGEGPTALNWPKPDDFNQCLAITVDPTVQTAIMARSREATGV